MPQGQPLGNVLERSENWVYLYFTPKNGELPVQILESYISQ